MLPVAEHLHRIKGKIGLWRQMTLDAFFVTVLARFLTAPVIQLQNILLIRLDAIGDYVLFRNFIEILRKSRKYRGHQITLLGNMAWKDLAESLDKESVSGFIWLNRVKFRKNPVYRFRLLNEIRSRGFETVIHPVYSRDFFWGDMISHYSGAAHRIASSGDTSNMGTDQKNLADSYYTLLIQDRSPVRFEFERNRFFFENLLGEKIKLRAPRIPVTGRVATRETYAVLFPGASHAWKRWPVEYFADIAGELLKLTNLKLYICGSANERYLGDEIIKLCQDHDRLFNRCGDTTLIELAKLLAGAKLLLTNDTSAAHMAAAVGTMHVLILFAGNHYGRFWPYPKNISKKLHCIMPELPHDQRNRTLLERSQDPYGYNLADLPPATVKNVLRRLRVLPRTSV
jgi:ADP-heptose:LPS heptosyltransferase